ncbi:TPA: DUF2231 domain-containing protein [Legionella pneumophila]|nr:DUF2231 domain-containing protein [Legionella pneumophila]
MIEIIPNWHPTFVHFTVALVSVSFIFHVLSYLTLLTQFRTGKLASELEIVAHWSLWLAALFTVATVLAGFYAFYTVKHNEISHYVMVIHRNLAITTATILFLTACWSVWRYIQHQVLTVWFVLVLFILQGLVIVTGWYGGELVYRYGTGVLSLPGEEKEILHHH